MRDPKYDILFEQVPIGPLGAKNRFYQVPHCNCGGYRDPSAAVAMRGIRDHAGRLAPGVDADPVLIEGSLEGLTQSDTAAKVAMTICGGKITYGTF